jgi:hypothetical protein
MDEEIEGMPSIKESVLHPGDMRVTVLLRQPEIAGQPATVEIQVEGVNSPFDGIRMLRAAEDQMRDDAERAVRKIMAKGLQEPVRIARVN